FPARAPILSLAVRKEKHDMGKPRARGVVAEVAALGQHEGKSAGLRGSKGVARDRGFGSLDDLFPRGTGQDPLGALEVLRQLGAHGWRVEAIRCAQLRIPELGIVETSGPGALDEADEAVRALHRRLIALRTQHENLSVP